MRKLWNRTDALTSQLLLILTLFTVTFFVYRDFGIRMIFGFGALCGILGLQGLSRLARKKPLLELSPLKVSFAVLVLAVLVNFLRPDSRHDADSFSFVISMVICTAFLLLANPTEAEGRRTLTVCFVGGFCMAAFVLFFVAFDDLFWKTLFPFLSPTAQDYLKIYVPKGYSITLGGCTYTNYILYLGASVGCAYAAARKFDIKSALALLCAAVFLVALLLVGRRGELLGAAVCIVLLVLALCNRKQRRILIVGGIVCAVAGFAVIVALLPWLKQFQPLVRYVMTVEKLLAGQDITSGRLELYTIALNAFAENPLFGIGWDQFHTLIPAEFLALHGQDVEDVHCIYLQFLTEAGIVSAPFLMMPLFYGYYLICKQFSRLKHREGMETAKMLCITSFLIQSFLLCMGIYDPNFQRVVFWCFYAIAMLLQITAMNLEGYRPDDPISRFLDGVIGRMTRLLCQVWEKFPKFWKEEGELHRWSLLESQPEENSYDSGRQTIHRATLSPYARQKQEAARPVLSLLEASFRDLRSRFREKKPCCPIAAVLAVFTVTFFYYRDFGHRMIFGYALLGAFLALHGLCRILKKQPPEFSPTVIAGCALVAVIGFHFLLPGARRDVDTLSYIISMVLCMACFAVAPVDGSQGRWAARAMYFGAMFMAAFVVIFTLLPQLFLSLVYPMLSGVAQRYYDFFAPLGYGVSLGTYSYTDYVLFLGVAVCCADLAVTPRTRKRVVADGLSLAFLLLAMVVLGRRGELLAGAVAVAVLVLALCNRKKRRLVLMLGGTFLVAAVVLFLLFLPQLKAIPVLARYVETAEQLLSGGDITSGRGALMALAVQGFQSAPLFGIGWGRYVDLSAQIGMCDTDGNLIEDCHNIYLQFACETGLVGALLICIPIFWLLFRTCVVLKQSKRAADKNALRFASVSFLIQFFLLFLGIYDPSFQKIVFWCFYALGLIFLRCAEEGSS